MKFKKMNVTQADIDKAVQDDYAQWDSADLTEKERLGLAYCRFNAWQWDDIFAPCPENFYSLPSFSNDPNTLTRDMYIKRPMEQINEKLSTAERSMYWWKFRLKKTEAEWRQWYYIDLPAEDFEIKKQIKKETREALIKRVLIAAVICACLVAAITALFNR